ncbi:MAG: hypothetical protein MUE85_10045 [Microscillaceae bacterium]|jgi:hypothetical protein|nr:hypothetical protein [Microscillaceae bacterium]
MFLQENTPEAHQLRLNLFNLLTSKELANIRLGLELLKTGGFHLAMFPYIWVLYRARTELYNADLKKEIEELYEAFFPQFFPPNVLEYLQNFLHKNPIYWASDRYKLLEKTEFFELLLSENIFTWQSLLGLWQADIFYTQHTCLTRFFLENIEQMPADFFLHPHLAAHQLHNSQINWVFEHFIESSFRLAFLQKFKTDKILDLQNTSLLLLPSEVAQIPDIEVLNIIGTRIKEIPIDILKRVKDVKANQKSLRMILRQVYVLGEYDYPFAQKVAFRKGRINFEGKKYAEAWHYLQITAPQKESLSLPEAERAEFWEMYFTCAIKLQEYALAQQILHKVCRALPKTNTFKNNTIYFPMIFGWKIWLDFLPEIFLQNTENQWINIIQPYCDGADPFNFFGLLDAKKWYIFAERFIYKNRLAEAFALLEKVKKYATFNTEAVVNWMRIFRALQAQKNYSAIITIFEQYEKSIFYTGEKTEFQLSRHFRCVYIWLEAYAQQQNWSRVELFCAEYISFFEAATNPKTDSKPLKAYGQGAVFYWVYYAYKYLYYVYTEQKNTVCAEYYRQKAEQVLTEKLDTRVR